MTAPVKIDVWSDIACPWCYIGKRKFEAGAAASGVPVEIEYHSYELSPDTPVDFEGSAIEFLSGHKGIPVSRAQAMTDQVSAIAAEVGLDYHYEDIHHTKTLLAHELLHFAKAHGKQLDVRKPCSRPTSSTAATSVTSMTSSCSPSPSGSTAPRRARRSPITATPPTCRPTSRRRSRTASRASPSSSSTAGTASRARRRRRCSRGP